MGVPKRLFAFLIPLALLFSPIHFVWGSSSDSSTSRSPALGKSWPAYYPKKFVSDYKKQNLKNQRLKSRLFRILSSVHVKTKGRDAISEECPKNHKCTRQRRDVSYYRARQFLFGHLHLKEGRWEYILQDVYCQKIFDEQDGVGQDQVPDHYHVNCEHSWPQSRFNSELNRHLQKVDLHHLYPSDSRANSSRSNHIFAEVDGRAINESCPASQKGNVDGQPAFEPPPRHRGNVARSLFYFSTRYKLSIPPKEETFLRKWHREDPVDSFEKWRNEEIADFQGTRNPFIDRPNLVSSIDDF